MDKPSSAEKAVERAKGAVNDQIARVVKMARSMKMDPDLSPVWDGEEFQGLPAEAKAEIVAWAKKEGYATPEPAAAPAPEQKEEKPDPRTEAVRNQIGRIAKMARGMKMEPDLSPVWDGEAFKALPGDLQDAVRSWAADQGYPTTTAVEAPAEEAAPEPVSEPASETSREKKERREGPKRKFMRYRVLSEGDVFAVHEDYEEWDDDAKAYKTKTIKTSIGFTGPLLEKLQNDDQVAETVAGFAAQVRGELDADGVKIFIDRPKNDPEKMYPKWKYTLEGKTVQEPIKLEDVPQEIIDLVKADKEYFRAGAWKKWFGKQMQRKREDVITAELAKLFPETAPKPQEAPRAETRPAAPAEAAPAVASEPLAEPAPEKEPEEAVMTPELAAGIEMLVDKFAPLFELPRDADKLIDYVTQFSKGIVELQVMKSGIKKKGLPPETLKRAVRFAILKKYEGDPATIAAVKKAMDAETEDDVIEVQDEWIEESIPDKKEEPADAAYRALRHDLDAIASQDELEEFVFSLSELKKSNIGSAASGADKLLADIEFGKAGRLSEERRKGLDRSDKEQEFFEQHPALDRRNVQPLEDGRVIAHVDRERPAEAMGRMLKASVDDALLSRGIHVSANVSDRIADYLLGIVTGRNPNGQVIARFTRDLAAYDARSEELTIKNIDKLGAVIANLAGEIEAKRKK